MKTSGEWSEDKKKTKSEPNTKLWKEKKKETNRERERYTQPTINVADDRPTIVLFWFPRALCVHVRAHIIPFDFSSLLFFSVFIQFLNGFTLGMCCVWFIIICVRFFFLELMPLVVISVHPGTKETSENKTTNRWKREREREKIYSSIECKCAFLWICTRSRRT